MRAVAEAIARRSVFPISRAVELPVRLLESFEVKSSADEFAVATYVSSSDAFSFPRRRYRFRLRRFPETLRFRPNPSIKDSDDDVGAIGELRRRSMAGVVDGET